MADARARLKRRLWRTAARILSERTDVERFMDVFVSVQEIRTSIEDVEGAALHFLTLPARSDIRRLQRRVTALGRRVADLDVSVARLERAAEARRGAGRAGPRATAG